MISKIKERLAARIQSKRNFVGERTAFRNGYDEAMNSEIDWLMTLIDEKKDQNKRLKIIVVIVSTIIVLAFTLIKELT